MGKNPQCTQLEETEANTRVHQGYHIPSSYNQLGRNREYLLVRRHIVCSAQKYAKPYGSSDHIRHTSRTLDVYEAKHQHKKLNGSGNGGSLRLITIQHMVSILPSRTRISREEFNGGEERKRIFLVPWSQKHSISRQYKFDQAWIER